MKPCSLIFTCLYILVSIGSHGYTGQSDGKLVMTIQRYKKDLDGFRESVGIRGPRKQKKAWWETATYDIYTLNPDGTGLTQLTEDGMSMRPKWALNGRFIAYVSGVGSSQNLCVMSKDGSEKKELLKNQIKINDFWWSPDSSAILVSVETRVQDKPEGYVVFVDGKRKERFGHPKWTRGWNHWDAHQAKVLNPHPHLLSALPEKVSWPKWSLDNRYIAFTTEGILAIADVESVSATGKWFLQRNEPPCNKIEEWSNDGKKILFYANGYICSAEVEKDRLTNMANLSMTRGFHATWNGDGTRVAFASKPPGRSNSEVYIMDADGSNLNRITHTNYNHLYLDWR
ncbi:MAG: TolB family protein [Candidatus Poribacteria bacterium]